MAQSGLFEENARNCEVLAEEAERRPDRNRYRRMAEAWKSLANLEAWLEGKQDAFKPKDGQ